MAATYAEDAEITAYSKEDKTGALKVDTARGRADIQKLYADLFKGRSPSARCRNNVEDAHFVGPDLLVIRGTFLVDVTDEHPLPFIQVRIKRGDRWLIMNLQLFGVATKWAALRRSRRSAGAAWSASEDAPSRSMKALWVEPPIRRSVRKGRK